MELMSSLLLCALVALLPPALGIAPSDIKIDDKKLLGKSSVNRKTVILNSNFPLVSSHSDLQAVFNGLECRKCINCMERAIKAHNVHTHVTHNTPNAEHFANDVIGKYHQNKSLRNKRDADEKVDEKTVIATMATRRTFKPKKNNNNVTVMKYSIGGQVYALKINEGRLEDASSQETDSALNCQVYSIKKYFPCGSPEGDGMLISAKRKAMRGKREQAITEKNLIATTEKRKPTNPISRAAKRQAYNAQILEHYMTSVEELY